MRQNSCRDFSVFNFICKEKSNKCGNVNGIHALLVMPRVKLRVITFYPFCYISPKCPTNIICNAWLPGHKCR